MRSVKHGGKKSFRYRYKASAVKRQNKKEKKKLRKVGCHVLDKAWDPKKTTRKNLATMGLAFDPNEVIGGESSTPMEIDMDLDTAKSLGTVKQQNRKKMTKSAKQGDVLKELGQIAIAEANEVEEQKKRRREKAKLLPSDVKFCEQMIAKHGTDYEAMARDPLNIWQNTARQIERKIAVFKKSQSS